MVPRERRRERIQRRRRRRGRPGGPRRLTHGNESDDWVDAELVDAASDADAAADASKPAATHGPPLFVPSSGRGLRADPRLGRVRAVPHSGDGRRVLDGGGRRRAPTRCTTTKGLDLSVRRRRACCVSPPTRPVYRPDSLNDFLETCDTCATPVRRSRGPKETGRSDCAELVLPGDALGVREHLRVHAHVRCVRGESATTMTFFSRKHHCSEAGGGLCANNQVNALMADWTGCAAEEDAERPPSRAAPTRGAS